METINRKIEETLKEIKALKLKIERSASGQEKLAIECYELTPLYIFLGKLISMETVKIVVIWEKTFLSTKGSEIFVNGHFVSRSNNDDEIRTKIAEIKSLFRMAGLTTELIEK